MALVFTGEAERGCGLRKHLGLYLVSDPGRKLPCTVMPFPIIPCECCGISPASFSRGLQWLRTHYFTTVCETKCPAQGQCAFTAPAQVPCGRCDSGFLYANPLDAVMASLDMEVDKQVCPSCRGRGTVPNLVGLMWVGTQYYTPASFMDEAKLRGVSKRIPSNQVPRDLRLGQSWIMLATRGAADCTCINDQDCPICDGRGKVSAVFYAFQPSRLEMIVTEEDLVQNGQPTQLAARLEKHNITPIIARPDQLVREDVGDTE